MDILTYVLARKGSGGSGGDGVLTGLSNVTIDEETRKLIFTLSDGTTITSQNPIPAVTEGDILTAMDENVASIQNKLGIPAALNTTITEIQDQIDDLEDIVITDVGAIIGYDENGQPVIQNFPVVNNALQLPIASGNVVGLVRGVSESASEEEKENKIIINEDGTMSVYALNVNKLYVDPEDDFILGGYGADID